MKKLLLLLVFAAGWIAQPTSAIPVTVLRQPGYFALGGGEFTITATQPSPAFDAVLSYYAEEATWENPWTKAVGFQTFCLDPKMPFTSPAEATIIPSGINLGTAWLYSQFARGSLFGYDYTVGAAREASAHALQNAIWAFQNMAYDPVAAAPFIQLAIGNVAGNLYADGNGAYNVAKLNLTTVAGEPLQPMLTFVPDGGSTLILLGLVLTSLGLIRRKI